MLSFFTFIVINKHTIKQFTLNSAPQLTQLLNRGDARIFDAPKWHVRKCHGPPKNFGVAPPMQYNTSVNCSDLPAWLMLLLF